MLPQKEMKEPRLKTFLSLAVKLTLLIDSPRGVLKFFKGVNSHSLEFLKHTHMLCGIMLLFRMDRGGGLEVVCGQRSCQSAKEQWVPETPPNLGE